METYLKLGIPILTVHKDILDQAPVHRKQLPRLVDQECHANLSEKLVFFLGWQVDVNAFLHFSVQYKKTMPPWNFFQLREFRVGFDKRQVGQLRMHLIPISLSLGV